MYLHFRLFLSLSAAGIIVPAGSAGGIANTPYDLQPSIVMTAPDSIPSGPSLRGVLYLDDIESLAVGPLDGQVNSLGQRWSSYDATVTENSGNKFISQTNTFADGAFYAEISATLPATLGPFVFRVECTLSDLLTSRFYTPADNVIDQIFTRVGDIDGDGDWDVLQLDAGGLPVFADTGAAIPASFRLEIAVDGAALDVWVNGARIFTGAVIDTGPFGGPGRASVLTSAAFESGNNIGGAGSTAAYDNVAIAEEPTTCIPDPTLVWVVRAGSACVGAGEQIVMDLFMRGVCEPQQAAGWQAFMAYDDTLMTLSAWEYTPAPFGEPLLNTAELVNPAPGQIDLAAVVDPHTQSPAAVPDSLIATVTFTANAGVSGMTALDFRDHFPPTRIAEPGGTDVSPLTLVPSADQYVDGTPPVFTVPADVQVNADAGVCTAALVISMPVVTDDCDPDPMLAAVRSDGLTLAESFPAGDTTITWTAWDHSGNTTAQVQTITVEPFNELSVGVELTAVFQPPAANDLTRAIRFRLFNGGALVSQVDADVVFNAPTPTGVMGAAIVLVPCGEYDCLTAADPLHTITRTDSDDFRIVGTQYAADFTNRTAAGGDNDALIGGNLNRVDDYVDVLDFGVMVSQFGSAMSPHTPVPPVGPHSDISGDGMVFTADFTFIQINFLRIGESACAGGLARADSDGPRARISIKELHRRGLGNLTIADLNGDGWVDERDMVLFAQGVRPGPGVVQDPAPWEGRVKQ